MSTENELFNTNLLNSLDSEEAIIKFTWETGALDSAYKTSGASDVTVRFSVTMKVAGLFSAAPQEGFDKDLLRDFHALAMSDYYSIHGDQSVQTPQEEFAMVVACMKPVQTCMEKAATWREQSVVGAAEDAKKEKEQGEEGRRPEGW